MLQYKIEFHLRGGTEKKLKIKIYPPCLEKVFFRKISLRGLQWYIFFLAYPLWCSRNKRLKMFWQGPHLNFLPCTYIYCALYFWRGQAPSVETWGGRGAGGSGPLVPTPLRSAFWNWKSLKFVPANNSDPKVKWHACCRPRVCHYYWTVWVKVP